MQNLKYQFTFCLGKIAIHRNILLTTEGGLVESCKLKLFLKTAFNIMGISVIYFSSLNNKKITLKNHKYKV